MNSISNWGDIIDDIPFTSCPFTMVYDNNVYTGVIAKSVGGNALQIVFDNPYVLAPPGMCIEVICDDVSAPVDETTCFDNDVSPLTSDTRLAVLNDEGCPIGYVTLADLTQDIINNINIPTSLCDLMGVSEIPQGPLLASDRVITTSGGCTLKSVLLTDVTCS